MKKWIYILIALLLPLAAQAQIGKQFWFAAPEMAQHSKDASLRLYLTAYDAPAVVTISMPANPAFAPITVQVADNGFEQVVLAPDYTTFMERMAAYHNRVNTNALSITSDQPISAYVQLTGVNSETWTLKAENALGTDFRVAGQNTYRNSNSNPQHATYRNAYSSAQIIATEDNTVVTITPTVLLYGDAQPVVRQITLNRGEVYSFRADSKKAESHIAGTHIEASRPVVVNSMDDSMSPYQDYFGEDAVADQMVPSALLGTDYIAIGHGLKWEGVCITDPETGETEFWYIGDNEVRLIHRDRPVQVFQISGHRNEAGGTQLPALHTGSKAVRYKRLDDSQWCWIHLLTASTNTGNIQVDGVPVPAAAFKSVPGAPEWSYAVLPMSDKAKNKAIAVTSSGEDFQMSVIDASSARQTTDGRPVPTSCSFGYFSNYTASEPPIEIDTIEQPDTIVPPDTIIVPDTTKIDSLPRRPKHGPHSIIVYGEAAYSHIPFGNTDFEWGLGYGAGVGLLYQYQKEHFLLNVGAGFLWQDAEHRRTLHTTNDIIDSQGTPCIVQSTHLRSDRSRLGYVEVPLLVGGTWDAFYLLGGVKIGAPLFGHTRMETRVTDDAIYDRYFVPLDNMTNHALRTDVPFVQKKERIDYKFDTRLSLELGVNLGDVTLHRAAPQDTVPLDSLGSPMTNDQLPMLEERSEPAVECRLGVFADYGLFWLPYVGTNQWLDDSNFMQVEKWEMSHPLNSTLNNRNWAQNFFVGIKLTVLFHTKAKDKETDK